MKAEKIEEIMNLGLHIIAAKRIQKIYPIKNIMEYGAGEISTLCFLNLNMFPDLKQLHSIEINKSYINCLNIFDNRWYSHIVPNEFEYQKCSNKILTENNIDVILVDSLTIEGRISTLNYLMSFNTKYIILHDSQHPIYNKTLNKYKYRLDLTLVEWHATIISNNANLDLLKTN